MLKATGRTKTYYAREAILENLEDMEDLHMAEQRMADIKPALSKTYTLDEVKNRLGLAD